MDPLDPANVCVHLTGVGPTTCHAGVDYDSVKAGTRRPEWPCTNLAVPCASRLLPAAQLAANQKWFDELAEQGVRIVHPDDGWVDREANTIRFVYPTMQHALPAPGVLVALGTREKWRKVMLTREVLQPVGMSSLWAFVEERPTVAAPDVDDKARALGERWIKAGGGFPDGSLFRTGVPIWLFGKRYEPGTPFRVDGDIMDHEAEGRLKGAWPDLRDAATRGVVLDVVRERRGRPSAYVAPVNVLGHAEARFLSGPRKGRRVGPDGWAVYGLGLDVLPVGANEAEALVSALEIAS